MVHAIQTPARYIEVQVQSSAAGTPTVPHGSLLPPLWAPVAQTFNLSRPPPSLWHQYGDNYYPNPVTSLPQFITRQIHLQFQAAASSAGDIFVVLVPLSCP